MDLVDCSQDSRRAELRVYYDFFLLEVSKLLKPWQRDPAEAVKFALEQVRTKTPSGYRMGFLILDMAVESIMKTYLNLPQRLTGAKTSHSARVNDLRGSFHDVLEGVVKASEDSYIEEHMDYIQHYHNIRNQIYHEGAGVTVHADDVSHYSDITTELLTRLLNVNLKGYIAELDTQDAERRKKEIEDKHHNREAEIEEARLCEDLFAESKRLQDEFSLYMDLVFESVFPHLLIPSIWLEASKIRDSYLSSGDVLGTEKKLEKFISSLFQVNIRGYLSEYVNEDDFNKNALHRYDYFDKDDEERLERIIENLPLGNGTISKLVMSDFLRERRVVLATIMWQFSCFQNKLEATDYERKTRFIFERVHFMAYTYRSDVSFCMSEHLADRNEWLERCLVAIKRLYITEKSNSKK